MSNKKSGHTKRQLTPCHTAVITWLQQLFKNLDSPLCPSVLPLNPAPLRKIDGVTMETPPLARPIPGLHFNPNGDGKPPPKSGATLARNRAIARFLYRSSDPVLVTFSKIWPYIYCQLIVSQNCATRQDYSSWLYIYCQLIIVSQNCATRQDCRSWLYIYYQLLTGFLKTVLLSFNMQKKITQL